MTDMFNDGLYSKASGSLDSEPTPAFSNPMDALKRIEKMMSESNITKKRKQQESIVDKNELYVIPGSVVNYSYVYLRGLRDRVLLAVSQLDPDNPTIWKQLHTFSVINEVLLELSKVVKLQDMVEPPTTNTKKKSKSKQKRGKNPISTDFDAKSLDGLLNKFRINHSGSMDDGKN